MLRLLTVAAFSLLGLAGAAAAQQPQSVVAVPQFSTPERVNTPAGETGAIARQISDIIAADLRAGGDIFAVGPDQSKVYAYQETTAPNFRQWRATGAKALVTGFVRAREDGRLTVGCYLHDLAAGREIARAGFNVTSAEWRRAAHRCADAVYVKMTGRPGGFDSRIAYVAESGSRVNRVKRVALMDADGSGHRFVTGGETIVLSPRLAPGGERLAYVSFGITGPQVRIVDLASNSDRPAIPAAEMSFGPSFSSDGRRLLLSVAANGNADIFAVDLQSGVISRLTATPGADTGASFSPDGSRIVFESDRSGSSQLYVMNADGSDARRISFGGARYGSPAWSPDGERIAFTRADGAGLRVGIMSPSGGEERLVTNGPMDEAPSWGGGSRNLLFQRREPGGRTALYIVGIDGATPRMMVTPQGGSDPHWSTGAAR